MRSIAAAEGLSTRGLLRRRCQPLLTFWLQLELPLAALPRSLFGASDTGAFVDRFRVPLATAAALASHAAILTSASQRLRLPGGAAELLTDALPSVLARLVAMHGSPDETEREGHTRGVASLAFHPNGVVVASGSGDGTLRLWEVGGKE